MVRMVWMWPHPDLHFLKGTGERFVQPIEEDVDIAGKKQPLWITKSGTERHMHTLPSNQLECLLVSRVVAVRIPKEYYSIAP